MSLRYISGQLGTAQLGLDQLGQYEAPAAPTVGKRKGVGGWRWEPSLLELALLTDGLEDADARELLQDVGEMFGRGSTREQDG